MDNRLKTKKGTLNGIQYNSGSELKFLEFFTNKFPDKKLSKPSKIKTELGTYTPDFEDDETLYEIKSLGTLKVLLGLENYIGSNSTLCSTLQFDKIKLVNQSKKKISLIIIIKADFYILPLDFDTILLFINHKNDRHLYRKWY